MQVYTGGRKQWINNLKMWSCVNYVASITGISSRWCKDNHSSFPWPWGRSCRLSFYWRSENIAVGCRKGMRSLRGAEGVVRCFSSHICPPVSGELISNCCALGKSRIIKTSPSSGTLVLRWFFLYLLQVQSLHTSGSENQAHFLLEPVVSHRVDICYCILQLIPHQDLSQELCYYSCLSLEK